MSVLVTDNVGVAAVTLVWTDPNNKPGTTGMKPQANGQWQAPMGPFPRGTVRWHITATDAAGNLATGPTANLIVHPCIT